MKKRRTVLVCFLLIAAMTIGVGYAALSDTLYATGTASINADDSQETFEGDIYFSKAVAGEGRATATISNEDDTPAGKNDKVTITVNDGIFTEVNDEVIVTLTVKSENDLPVYVQVQSLVEESDYFSVTVVPTGFAADAPALIQPNSTVDYVVTIKQIKTAVADQSLSFSFQLYAATENPTP